MLIFLPVRPDRVFYCVCSLSEPPLFPNPIRSFTTSDAIRSPAAEGVKGYYPAFDITPPELVTGVVTDRGIFSPYELAKYVEQTDGVYKVVV